MEEESLRSHSPGVKVSMFDYSVENHFKAIDTISKLCEEQEEHENIDLEDADIQRLSSSITFLREWRYFNYEDRIVRFASETDSTPVNDAVTGISIPQFSSATVPKDEELSEGATSPGFSKDFVMYVGGSVWGLDWCPRVHKPDCRAKCEFIAVAAHPPNAYYHQIGVPLTGRGLIQIWSILNASVNKEEACPSSKKPKRRHQSDEATKEKSTEPKRPRGRPKKMTVSPKPKPSRPRGRPRKNPIDKSTDNVESNSQTVPALSVEYPEHSSELLTIEGVALEDENHLCKNLQVALENDKQVCENLGGEQKSNTETAAKSNAKPKASLRCRRVKSCARKKSKSVNICPRSPNQNRGDGSPDANHPMDDSSEKDSAANCSLESSSCTIPQNVALPRVILCLAHNGKVAWDVKWRPNLYDSKCKHRMGFLAVLLGNGSLEVWEIPLPHAVEVIYSSKQKEGTDPRFVKLEPVFRCSMLKCADTHSIPLTVEWSICYPYDYLLAGCHDGTVSLWKFSASGSSKDTRPLLRFSADTCPIRAIAWAPVESDVGGGNVILTAGHEGLKLWDIRDPFRPLWDLHPVPRFIYSIDWLPDPRCIIMSFDDGTMRVLSLVTSAYDVPATGKPFTGTKQQGVHVYNCTSFAVWSVQVSRLTGMVAYCSADGTVLHFQLTNKAVEKDFSRNRAPHFMCGALSEEESTVIVKTPLPNTPVTFKKPTNPFGDSSRSLKTLVLADAGKRANAKKAKAPPSDNQTLALCYSDEPGVESESELTLATLKSQKKPKSKSSRKNEAQNDQALVCRDDERQALEGKEERKGETKNEMEVYPSKIVAMHRVRWNMNKGSERWLCYGGAAGIVRCQEIIGPEVVKKQVGRKRKDQL